MIEHDEGGLQSFLAEAVRVTDHDGVAIFTVPYRHAVQGQKYPR